MNILQVNKFFYIRDGTSRYFFNVSELLRKYGHVVSFFSMKHPKNKPCRQSKYFVSNISFEKNKLSDPLKIVTRIFYSFEARNQIKKLLDKMNIDIAHIHSIYHHISPSILVEIKKRKIPIVMTVHDYHLIAPNYLLFHNGKICEVTKPSKYYKALFHKCVRNSYIASLAEFIEKYINNLFNWERNLIDIFITPTNFVKGKLIEYGFSKDKIVVLPLFIDYKNYKPNYHPGKYILYFGGLYEQKGVEFLIKVMENLPKIPCLIVGDGSERNRLQNIIKKEKINNVELLGHIEDSKLIELVSNSCFTVMPSKWFEGFGLVNLEAHACGKPVVASQIGGIPDVVEDGVTGFLFKPGSIEDCMEKIQKIWNNPSLVKKMGRNAREKTERDFSPEDHYKKLLEIYQLATKKNKLD